jgi:hypothetical protein
MVLDRDSKADSNSISDIAVLRTVGGAESVLERR